MAHVLNIPLIPLIPTSSNNTNNIHEIAFKTVPSATKLEIKQLLQSFYGLEVQKVRTLNMKGKTKRVWLAKGESLVGNKPDYKKAYVTLKNPLSNYPIFYPSPATIVHDEYMKKNKKMMTLQ
ncbi:uncharacterized protein LOC130967235 [Arachis stenosperma]|uniref:uncharacterized protein LOC130967235 n=1 Tax=Arachis stenosperma TaxID=217475 RepID=UPI0025ACE3DC|nr:uncharacterized protein LOC130967235 [Arachis stenosperma]